MCRNQGIAFLSPEARPSERANGWTAIGLFTALGGPLLLASPPAQVFYAWAGEGAAAVGQTALCGIVALVLAILRFGERLPFAAAGLVRPRVKSIIAGLCIGVGVFVGLALIALALFQLGVFENKAASEVVLGWPLPYRLAVAIAAGFIEEVLYRGYAIERLTAIMRSRWLAATVALLAFALAHVPFWGWAAIATPLVGGAFFTCLYIWRRDLITCIVAHSTIDVIGIAVVPALAT